MPFTKTSVFLENIYRRAREEGAPGTSVSSSSRGVVNPLYLMFELAGEVVFPAIELAYLEGQWVSVAALDGAPVQSAPEISGALFADEALLRRDRCSSFAASQASAFGWVGDFRAALPMALSQGWLEGLASAPFAASAGDQYDWAEVDETYVSLRPVLQETIHSLASRVEKAWASDVDTRSPAPGSQRKFAELAVAAWWGAAQWLSPVVKIENEGGDEVGLGLVIGPDGNVVLP